MKTEEVLLPKTSFSTKSNWLENEPRFMELWKTKDVFNRRNALNTEKTFVLHDGPPYANGNLHLGHFVNKVMKDFFVKFHMMRGYNSDMTVGFDCHGLPTELEVLKLKQDLTDNQLRQECFKYSSKQLEKQKKQMSTWGLTYNSNHYATTQYSYEAKELFLLHDFLNKGLLYQEERPVWYSPSNKTVLAESELEYKETSTDTLYARYYCDEKGFYFLTWTTQPWTLLGNMGLAVNRKATYQKYKLNQEYYVVMKGNYSFFNEAELVEEFSGESLLNLEYNNPMGNVDVKYFVQHANFVKEGSGTGVVHLCPAHGEEDFEALSNVESENLVDDNGNLFMLNTYWEDSFELMKELTKKHSMYFSEETLTHDYPYDWRSKKKVLMRLEKQFFLNLDELKDNSLANLSNVQFSNSAGKNRLKKAVSMRQRWCLSRQRKWGFPMALFLKQDGTVFLNKESQMHLEELFEKYGSRVWFENDVEYLLPDNLKHLATELTKCEHTVDVWFDSSVSWFSVLNNRTADMYLEGSDQSRGWFQGSLLLSTAYKNESPFKKLFTHGFVVDKDGKKMSKSLGNVVTVEEARKAYNTDLLRLWVLNANVHEDLKYSDEFMKTCGDAYFKLRNTVKFLLGNMYGYDGLNHELLQKDKDELEFSKVMLDKCCGHMEEMNLRLAFETVLTHVKDFSSRYVNVPLKCDLYEAGLLDEKRQRSQQVLFNVLLDVLKTLAFMTPYLAEDAYQNLPDNLKKHDSVFFLNL